MTDRAIRDVIIFVTVMVVAGWIGVLINLAMQVSEPMESLGVLLWLLVPPITAILLSVRAGTWMQRLGLGLGASGSGKWYFLALLATPIAVALLLPLALFSGALKFVGTGQVGIVELGVTFLFSAAIKNVFEEICWRGFLTPRLEETRFAGLANHIITGLVWALWHVPYWLFFLSAAEITSHAALPVWGLIVVAFFIMPMQAILYGELRLITGSVWPPYVLHTISNVVTMLFLSGGMFELHSPFGALVSPGTSGILYSIILAGAGLWLYRKRSELEKGAE